MENKYSQMRKLIDSLDDSLDDKEKILMGAILFAIDKEEARTPTERKENGSLFKYCPYCERCVGSLSLGFSSPVLLWKFDFCPKCGQHIGWEEFNKEEPIRYEKGL